MNIIGIDPGNAGAIVVLTKDRIIIQDMPTLVTEGKGKTKKGNVKKHTHMDELAIKSFLETYNSKGTQVFIEKCQSMPGQGAAGTANYMCGYGILRGICVGLDMPYTLVHPATWKKKIMRDMDKGKEASILRAKQLFPKADIGKKDGRAEALLIAYYGKTELL